MIEEIVRDWLIAGGFSALMEMPEDYPGGSFVLIEKVGSGHRETGLEAATLAIQSYGDSLYDAAALNVRVKARMAELYWQPQICHLECNSDYNYTDEERKRYRYQAVFDLLFYD